MYTEWRLSPSSSLVSPSSRSLLSCALAPTFWLWLSLYWEELSPSLSPRMGVASLGLRLLLLLLRSLLRSLCSPFSLLLL